MPKGFKAGGREKGTPNKMTAELRAKFEKLLDDNLESIQTDLDRMQPRFRVHYIIELAKFCVPTLKAQEIDLTSDGENFTPIVITGMEIK
jgi:hypothetical protein